MNRNPLNNDREPRVGRMLAIGAAALVILGVGGVVLHGRTERLRAQNVGAAVLAAGYGDAVVRPIAGDECWRARDGFTWTSARASGSACAGPGAEVHLFPGQPRPRLSGVSNPQVSKPKDAGSAHDPL